LRRRLGKGVQVGGGVLVKPQGTRQRIEHLSGRVLIAPLFETDVVVGTDSGEHRHLLAPQTGRAPPP
jgi:hypothetical protein